MSYVPHLTSCNYQYSTIPRIIPNDTARKGFKKEGQVTDTCCQKSVNTVTQYSSFAHDVISSHWAPCWLTLQITSADYSEIVVSIYNFIVSLSVLWMLILRSVT